MRKIIEIRKGVARMPEWRMAAPVDFELCEGEHIAITGRNGSGKSMLADIIAGRHPLAEPGARYDFGQDRAGTMACDNIRYITFRDSYGTAGDSTYYLQQRWNQQEIDPETPTAGEILDHEYAMGGDTPQRRRWRDRLYGIFGIEGLADKYIILLSSGETRKLVLVRALLSMPRVLIIDNPFIGLDTGTRATLKQLLGTLAAEGTLNIIMIMTKTGDIPPFITHVVEVDSRWATAKKTLAQYLGGIGTPAGDMLPDGIRREMAGMAAGGNSLTARDVVRMDGVTIRYGSRTILKDMSWTVRRGERWALSGANGAGKSTLLSLICADNPQAYACGITLFDTPRGSGESIWEIKKHIGYVSPEMHRAYKHNIEAVKIVASGLRDTTGLYMHPTPQEYETCRMWMRIFGLEGLEDRPFLRLSDGEQRLVLLARAFVKDPGLLILDEPFHGLDDTNRCRVRGIIEEFCRREGKTLIMVCHYDEELPCCITHRIHLERNI